MQIPVLNKDIQARSILNVNQDFDFVERNVDALTIAEIKNNFEKLNIIKIDKKKGDAIFQTDFRKAKIGIVVVCRLHSTRLVRKALQKIGELTSVERCIKNVLKFENIDTVCLATSTVDEDAELENYTYSPKVKFHKGSPDDVLRRMLDVTEMYDLDIVSRVTADTVFPSNEVYQILLKSHFESGVDYTKSANAAFGANLSVISVNALKKVHEFFPVAQYSEYLIYYFANNPQYFKVNDIQLPKEFVRDYRLTLDYPEDLKLYNIIQNHFDKNDIDTTIHNIYKFLDENPEIAQINKGMKVKYETNNELIENLKKYTTINA
jgi:spore coat polysaccharide biosynthesis protein SpsF (cytidylyltransferase family)